MHSIPKILQTREDFDQALALARSGDAPRATVAKHFAGLAESAQHYVFDKVLAANELPTGPMPDYCVTEASEQDPVRRQLKLSIDPQARLFELGYTLANVASIVNELGAQ
ncbi:MAG: hypothetical protein HHJ15_18200 [Rhodoferax sp.]|uniref:hypothetical protein n=1 Tax=Rhodoferax sp. TaxID=50421 RepID=UPI00180D2E66|nr:hypothetical protein [Rhodoferax sp.]NMM21855.1 hypothetical protein [Rhodoferax sp.]